MRNCFWPLLVAVQSMHDDLNPWYSSAKLQALQSCALEENSVQVSERCLYLAKYPRSRRASSTFLKSELEAMCSLPCQKSRLFTTPKVTDFSLDSYRKKTFSATWSLVQWLDSLQDQRWWDQTWWVHWHWRLHWFLSQIWYWRVRSRF